MFELPFPFAQASSSTPDRMVTGVNKRIALLSLPALASLGAVAALQASGSENGEAYPVGWVNSFLALNYAQSHRN